MKTKKELKTEYKQHKPTAGVYQIKNTKNGRTLIEAASNIPAKWNRHRTELKFGSHRNGALQKDWNEMGEDAFTFDILSELKSKEEENADINTEVKLLLEMVEEEMDMPAEMKY